MDSRKLVLSTIEQAIAIKRLQNIARLMEDQLQQFAQPKPKEKKSA